MSKQLKKTSDCAPRLQVIYILFVRTTGCKAHEAVTCIFRYFSATLKCTQYVMFYSVTSRFEILQLYSDGTKLYKLPNLTVRCWFAISGILSHNWPSVQEPSVY